VDATVVEGADDGHAEAQGFGLQVDVLRGVAGGLYMDVSDAAVPVFPRRSLGNGGEHDVDGCLLHPLPAKSGIRHALASGQGLL